MPTITTKDDTTLVRDQVTAIQASASTLLDFTKGSVLRALVESVASVVLWLQGLVLLLLATTRAATSEGSDLDSWMADFGLPRLGAQASSGAVTFSRFTASGVGLVPAGGTVQGSDGATKFVVVADPTNIHWSALLGGYTMADTVASVTVPVVALTAGTVGNVIAGGINTLASAMPGIDTVTNALAFENGRDAEKDAELRARFVSYLASLSRATRDAVIYAAMSVQQGVSVSLVENEHLDTTAAPGYFYVVADDGSGAPPGGFLTTVQTAVEAVRPLTVTYGVFAPTTLSATIAMTVAVEAGYSPSEVRAEVAAAVTAYVAALGLGGTLEYSRLYYVAWNASAGVANVTALTVNGGTADVVATARQKIVATSVTVS